jgi:hypothetical protein
MQRQNECHPYGVMPLYLSSYWDKYQLIDEIFTSSIEFTVNNTHYRKNITSVTEDLKYYS